MNVATTIPNRLDSSELQSGTWRMAGPSMKPTQGELA
jgi:hypothetical protein